MREKITSRKNDIIKHVRKLGRDRGYRLLNREFVCDGEKLLVEAIGAGAEILTVLCDDEKSGKLPEIPRADIYMVPRDVLDSVTTLSTSQSVVFTCRMPQAPEKPARRAVLLDRLQDTGNVGTIIRTADAFGIEMIIEDGCADIYNPKTIRSAMGSLFRVPVISREMESAICELRDMGVCVYAATLCEDAKILDNKELPFSAVVIGNEGNGVRREVQELCDGSVIIPMRGGAESLNAAIAAGILMYKMSER